MAVLLAAFLAAGCATPGSRGSCTPDPAGRGPSPSSPPESPSAASDTAGSPPAAHAEGDSGGDTRALTDFGNARPSLGHLAGFEYLEVVLGDAPSESPMPLIVGIHGLGDRPRLPYPPYVDLPVPVRVVVPRAPEPFGKGFTWLPVRVRDGETARLSRALEQRASELAQFLGALRERYRVQGSPIVTGFSQGGMLTYTLAVHHPAALGAAFPLAGWLPPPLWPDERDRDAPNPPIRAMHGDADVVIPPGPTLEAVRALEERGYDVELEPFEGVGHHMTAAMDELMRRWLSDAIERARAAEGPAGDRAVGEQAADVPP